MDKTFLRAALFAALLGTAAFGAPVSLNNDDCSEDGNSLDSSDITNGIHVAGGLTLFPAGPGCSTSWTITRDIDMPAGTYDLTASIDVTINFGFTILSVNNGESLLPNAAEIVSFLPLLGHQARATVNFGEGETVGSDSDAVTFNWGGGILELVQFGQFSFVMPEGSFAQANFDFPASGVSQIIANGPNPVPEPSTYALAGLGLGLIAWRRRR